MRKFNDLPAAQQEQIRGRFILPEDTTSVEVNAQMVPFTRISGGLFSCTVINNNFHVHGNRQNNR